MRGTACAVPLSLWSQVRVLQEPRLIISINRPKGHHLCEFEIDGGGSIKSSPADGGWSKPKALQVATHRGWYPPPVWTTLWKEKLQNGPGENCLRRQLLYLSNHPHSAYTDTTTNASHTHTHTHTRRKWKSCTVFTSASNRWLSRVLLVLPTTFLRALLSSTWFYKKPLKQCKKTRFIFSLRNVLENDSDSLL